MCTKQIHTQSRIYSIPIFAREGIMYTNVYIITRRILDVLISRTIRMILNARIIVTVVAIIEALVKNRSSSPTSVPSTTLKSNLCFGWDNNTYIFILHIPKRWEIIEALRTNLYYHFYVKNKSEYIISNFDRKLILLRHSIVSHRHD